MLCNNPECKKSLTNGRKYCGVYCNRRENQLRYNARLKTRPAKLPHGPCTHETPPYRVCIRCANVKRRDVYRENKKYYLLLPV